VINCAFANKIQKSFFEREMAFFVLKEMIFEICQMILKKSRKNHLGAFDFGLLTTYCHTL